MQFKRRDDLVYGLLIGAFILVVGWQVEEHLKVRESAKTDLRKSARAIANTVGAFIRGLQFRGAVFRERLDPVLDELVGATNEVVHSGDLVSIEFLNAEGVPLAFAGKPVDLSQTDLVQAGERWGRRTVSMVYPVEGVANVTPEGTTNAGPILLITNNPPDFRGRNRRDRMPGMGPGPGGGPGPDPGSNGPPMGGGPMAGPPNGPGPGPRPDLAGGTNLPPPPDDRPPGRDGGPRLPFWARAAGLNMEQFEALIKSRELHGLVLAMSTDTYESVCLHDLWLREIIIFFAAVSAIGVGVAWRNLAQTADLQIRLVRASELNTHLKEMNLAAAGLAHETRNPLNIVRGLAHMISRQPDLPAEVRDKSRQIIGETDKVAAQLNEFINYSRPRELRRVALPLQAAVNEVARALNFDIEEKRVKLEVKPMTFSIEADEQLFRQALFNLVLNAIQAVEPGGEIEVAAERRNAQAVLEIRDNGPGVPPDRREEIFKPYFTTQAKGTGLGLAVVQQIVLAHGWEIQCLGREPKGAIFRISHLKVVG